MSETKDSNVSNPQFGRRKDVDYPTMQVYPDMELSTDGKLHLTTWLSSALEEEDSVLERFVQDYANPDIEGEVAILLHFPLSEVLEADQNLHYHHRREAYPASLKPKYEAIRAQLMELVKSIDEMKYYPDAD